MKHLPPFGHGVLHVGRDEWKYFGVDEQVLEQNSGTIVLRNIATILQLRMRTKLITSNEIST